ncbi:hypothetical protein KCP71_11415 [Salmonella enterica subsp. enterica]|nr:hypothetical protein KCP71_11415 [Salmonella enterica subsp. enterica]
MSERNGRLTGSHRRYQRRSRTGRNGRDGRWRARRCTLPTADVQQRYRFLCFPL